METRPTIAVIGLGYVGAPLAAALGPHFDTLGVDIDAERVEELNRGIDRTHELSAERLKASSLKSVADIGQAAGRDLYIITVPTPIDDAHQPDLGAVRAACRAVGGVMRAGATVVLESTVYPGVTETVCAAALNETSGLRWPEDFRLGYSPERINPGDRVHTVDKIVKVVAGDRPDTTALLAHVYGAMNGGQIFEAASIKAAEAAKVIENAQRDINIAFVNEVAALFHEMGVPIRDVLAAAGTKWNFLPFSPGLVGGHCIGVDPYYLAHAAHAMGRHPDVILAGRRINDAFGGWIGREIDRAIRKVTPEGRNGRVLLLGLTFKEDVPDLRNTKVIDVIRALEETGHRVDVHDALADVEQAQAEYGLALIHDLNGAADYDAVIGAVPHAAYRDMSAADLRGLSRSGGLLADIKGLWDDTPSDMAVWRL